VSIDKPDAAIRHTLSWVATVFGPFLGLVLVTLFFAWLTRSTGSFLKVESWRTIAVQTVVVGTAALGMTAIMISGGSTFRLARRWP
jgi:ribose/xylose/arabinose/galactoside ABC-type transport system permease subunit